jgi:hypothetical protein
VLGGELWIADLAAEHLLAVSLAAASAEGPSLRRVPLVGASAPTAARAHRVGVGDEVHLREFADVVLRLRLPCAAGEAVEASNSCTVAIGDEGAGLLACDVRHATVPVEDHVQVLAPIAESGEGVLRLRVDYSVREDETGATYERRVDWLAPLRVSSSGEAEVELRLS